MKQRRKLQDLTAWSQLNAGSQFNPVLDTCQYVAQNSSMVGIDHGAVRQFCSGFKRTSLKSWLTGAPVNIAELDEDARMHFLLLLSGLSFRFWGQPKWAIEYNGKQYDGSLGMIVALWQAVKSGDLYLEPSSWTQLNIATAKKILTGNILVPRFQDRLRIIREFGFVLRNRFRNSYKNLLIAAEGDALKLLQLLTRGFFSFRDTSEFRNRRVCFYKRAQLLIADTYRMLPSSSGRPAQNVNLLTACADYKIPWVLRQLGVLKYTESLARRIAIGQHIPAHSQEEVEIRANTVCAVDAMKHALAESAAEIMSFELNDYLWLLGQQRTPEDVPYHLTETMFY